MTLHYWLFIVFAGNMQVVGPFHGLPACEKAAAMATIAARESVPADKLFQAIYTPPGTACLSQKHVNFKYKEPK